MVETQEIILYVVTGVYGFLILFLLAFVINLYLKVQALINEDDDDDDERSDSRGPPRPQQQPDFSIPKPVISRDRNYDPNDQPGYRSSPDRNGNSNFRGSKDFGGIDFNNRMAADKPFKPSSSQGGSYKNPLFDQGPSELDNKYDYTDPRDKQPKPQPQPPGFRLPNAGFNQPNNSLYPRREFQNNNFRY